jgi:hypothetical protein
LFQINHLPEPLNRHSCDSHHNCGSSSLLVHPTESGSAYPKENKAIDRMFGATGQALIKSVDTVSIWLKSGGLLPFGPSSCTKSEEEPL